MAGADIEAAVLTLLLPFPCLRAADSYSPAATRSRSAGRPRLSGCAARGFGNYSGANDATMTLARSTIPTRLLPSSPLRRINGTTQVDGTIYGSGRVDVDTSYVNGLVLLTGSKALHTGDTTVRRHVPDATATWRRRLRWRDHHRQRRLGLQRHRKPDVSGVLSGSGTLHDRWHHLTLTNGRRDHTGPVTISGGTVVLRIGDVWGTAQTYPAIRFTVNAGARSPSSNCFNMLNDLTLNGGTLFANGGQNGGETGRFRAERNRHRHRQRGFRDHDRRRRQRL